MTPDQLKAWDHIIANLFLGFSLPFSAAIIVAGFFIGCGLSEGKKQ